MDEATLPDARAAASSAAYDRHLAEIDAAPRDAGPLVMIVRRPGRDEREVLEAAELTPEDGLVGDDWRHRGGSRSDGMPKTDAQLTLMSTRVLAAIEPDRSRWPLAGDQLYVDLDLSEANLPAGTRLLLGDAELEVTPLPHTGCSKFAARFGLDALRWISTPAGRARRMRGMYVRILRGGSIRPGDTIRRA